jgi:L-ribulose-5-phosphate 3-epimerase
MTIHERLAVCTWSLQPESPSALFAHLRTIGLRRIQAALDPILNEPSVWGNFGEACEKEGVQIVSGMFGTIGEDYSTIESIRRTGGLTPDATWERNWARLLQTVRLAAEMRLGLVAFHAGFLPHDPADPDFTKLLGRLDLVATLFAGYGITLALETGQETAAALNEFLRQLKKPNLGVNFDPANMILYDQGDPIEALRLLAPSLKQCHIKDAIRTKVPGEWGREVPVGTGQVDWRQFLDVLDEIGFHGDLCIEREAGDQRSRDIQTARELLEKTAQGHGTGQ